MKEPSLPFPEIWIGASQQASSKVQLQAFPNSVLNIMIFCKGRMLFGGIACLPRPGIIGVHGMLRHMHHCMSSEAWHAASVQGSMS